MAPYGKPGGGILRERRPPRLRNTLTPVGRANASVPSGTTLRPPHPRPRPPGTATAVSHPAVTGQVPVPQTNPVGGGISTTPGEVAQPRNPLPFDPVYQQQDAGLNTRAGNAQLDYTYGTGALGRDYGYTQGANGTLSVDPSNPYSRSALLQRSIDQARAGTNTSYAARGQLYSGALQNAQNSNAFQGNASQNLLQNQFLGGMHNLDITQRNTLQGIGDQRTTNFQDYVNRAIAQGVDPYAVPAAPKPPGVKGKPPRPNYNKPKPGRRIGERRR